MSSRSHILQAIQSIKPERVDLPPIPSFNTSSGDLPAQFKEALSNNKGLCLEGSNLLEMFQEVRSKFNPEAIICSLVAGLEGNLDINSIADPHDLALVDLAVVKSSLGVAENAALWLPEASIGYRALPFIAQHLIIILEEQDLVADMHHAYEKIKIDSTGYGVFIAGPSKTADIEQSLVIGAHGARSLTVFLKKQV